MRLVLVSAPAGYGKSTTIAAWLAQHGTHHAWFRVDCHDNDPAAFWTNVSLALSSITPNAPKVAGPEIAASNGRGPRVVSTLANALETAPPLVLVLDDFHLVDQPTIHDDMAQFIECIPDHVLLIVCTRRDPGFPLARLRANSQLSEIRSDTLAFSSDEAQEFTHSALPSANNAEVRALNKRTEGWVVGLVLAVQASRSSAGDDTFFPAFHGAHRFVREYLSSEFLDQVEIADRRLLLVVALLGEANGDLLDEVLDEENCDGRLAAIAEQHQILVGYDSGERWYRLHHLAQDALQETIRTDPNIQGDSTYEKAARWHLKKGHWLKAFDAYIRAASYDAAADILVEHGTFFYNQGHVDTVQNALDQLSDIGDSRRDLIIFSAWTAMLQGRLDHAGNHIESALSLPGNDFEDQLLASLQVMHSLLMGDVKSALGVTVPPPPHFDAALPMSVGCAFLFNQEWNIARRYLTEAMHIGRRTEDHFAVISSLSFHSALSLEQGLPDEARDFAQKALELAQSTGLSHLNHLGLAYVCLAGSTQSRAMALLNAQEAHTLAISSSENLVSTYTLTRAAEAFERQGDPSWRAALREARRRLGKCLDPGLALSRFRSAEASVSHSSADHREQSSLGLSSLTEREQEILRFLSTTRTQREIADELHVSMNTVKTHVSAVYRKLGVSNRSDAVKAARKHRDPREVG